MSEQDAVERLTDKEKWYDSENAVLIIDCVEYDVLALWGHVEALEQALEAQRSRLARSQQENERLRRYRDYARHTYRCGVVVGAKCDCGYAALEEQEVQGE